MVVPRNLPPLPGEKEGEMKLLSLSLVLLSMALFCWGFMRIEDWTVAGRLIACGLTCALYSTVVTAPYFDRSEP